MELDLNKIHQGDALQVLKDLPDESVDMVITSPPYWALRDYGMPGQLGLEPKFEEYISKLCDIFDEAKRVLKKTGTLWVNIGDTYMNDSSYQKTGRQGMGNDKVGMIYKDRQGLRQKSLCQIPSRFAIEMTNRGWILRNEIIWHKPNCMPQSVKDRFTVDFEKIFFFVKEQKYFFETQKEKLAESSIKAREYKLNQTKHVGAKMSAVNVQTERRGERFIPLDGRNMRAVWKITTRPFKEAHFATSPEALVEPPLLAGCPRGGRWCLIHLWARGRRRLSQYGMAEIISVLSLILNTLRLLKSVFLMCS